MLTNSAQRGFSLIELMVTVAVMVLLALLAVPSMRDYAESSKILGTAEAFYASAQMARAEAIRRNTPVELVLTSDAPVSASADTTALSTSGPNWMTRQVPPTTEDNYEFIEGKAGAEGSGRAGGASTVSIAASATKLQFTALGGLSGTDPVRVNFSSTNGTCAPSGTTRCLRVVVSPGGRVQLCDPAVSTAGDTRKC